MRQSYDVVLASLNNEDNVRLSIRRILKVEVGSTFVKFLTLMFVDWTHEEA